MINIWIENVKQRSDNTNIKGHDPPQLADWSPLMEAEHQELPLQPLEGLRPEQGNTVHRHSRVSGHMSLLGHTNHQQS